jgi:hypothetical protein
VQTNRSPIAVCGLQSLFKKSDQTKKFKENYMSIGTILLIILILALVGALPSWGHSKNWGYGPSGGLGLVVVILIILVLMGRI